jgi:hypothetical protein
MASAWELDIPSTEKMVLLCLCDFSGDGGVCWPSVPTIARKCSKSERTVQTAIQWLRSEGFCSWDETPGKPHRFTLNPRKICTSTPAEVAPLTPAESAPRRNCAPQVLQQTPAEVAPKPLSRTTTTVSETARAWALPAGVSLQVWQDFLSNRKRKRLGSTQTAWKGFLDDLARVSLQTGIPPPKLIEHAAAKGWGSINAPDEDKGHGRTNGLGRNQSSDGLSPTTRAALKVFGSVGAGHQ